MTQNGIIAIDKPEGISSAAVVAIVKRKLGVKKVGHTGTLDPFATGLMLCGINKGTKLSQFFLGSSKHYLAEVALGIETDTQDYTGQLVNRCDPLVLDSLTHDTIIETVEKLRGIQMQKPPLYSALKHNGKPLYKLAREGKPVQKPSRMIEIHSIEILNIQKESAADLISKPKFLSDAILLTISVHCSSGTYIRTLAHDIGQQLECGGCLSSLRRTKTCGFSIDDAISLSQLEDMSQEETLTRILPMAQSIPFMPVIQADDKMMETIRFGRTFRFQQPLSFADGENLTDFKIIDTNGELVAIVEYNRVLDKYYYCCVFIN
ncbi:MAG: tRNA pseudouridine(55) synthase TruB [Desulfamplus sp.]|nr:tRNA pseudouridine(55) synthase TruB [Desulfamplus sp.]